MEKPKLIILEGVDKTGKSSVYQAFRKMTDYGPLVIDRFLGSNYAYDFFWKRNHHIKDYGYRERLLNNIFDVYLIYLVCDENELNKRLKKGKEDYNFAPIKRIRMVDKLFYLYFNLSNFKNKTIINTSKTTPEETSELIVKFMEDKKPFEIPFEWAREMNKIKFNKTMKMISQWNNRS